jgi:hypothetical protein
VPIVVEGLVGAPVVAPSDHVVVNPTTLLPCFEDGTHEFYVVVGGADLLVQLALGDTDGASGKEGFAYMLGEVERVGHFMETPNPCADFMRSGNAQGFFLLCGRFKFRSRIRPRIVLF